MAQELEILTNILLWLIQIGPVVIASIGFGLARAFATKTNGDKSLDDYIKDKEGFWSKLGGDMQWLVNKILHFVHHYWIAAIFLYLFNHLSGPIMGLPNYPVEILTWFFLGMFTEDGMYHIANFLSNVQQQQPPIGGEPPE